MTVAARRVILETLGGDLWICHQCLDMSTQTCSWSDWGPQLRSRGSWLHRALYRAGLDPCPQPALTAVLRAGWWLCPLGSDEGWGPGKALKVSAAAWLGQAFPLCTASEKPGGKTLV